MPMKFWPKKILQTDRIHFNRKWNFYIITILGCSLRRSIRISIFFSNVILFRLFFQCIHTQNQLKSNYYSRRTSRKFWQNCLLCVQSKISKQSNFVLHSQLRCTIAFTEQEKKITTNTTTLTVAFFRWNEALDAQLWHSFYISSVYTDSSISPNDQLFGSWLTEPLVNIRFEFSAVKCIRHMKYLKKKKQP